MIIRHLFIPLFIAATTVFSACKSRNAAVNEPTAQPVEVCPVQFNGDSAFAFVEKQCDFGARTPNSDAHRLCGDFLVEKFRSYGLDIVEQKMPLTAWDGKTLQSRNIIASYLPENADRIVLCAHWDCRPWCDEDPDEANHRQPVMGANDGASGVAVLLEVARNLKELKPTIGIDFICFDAEDYGCPYWADNAATDGSDWCLGSQYWAKNPHKAGYAARYGILLDMVGGKDARFHYEGFSLRYAQDVVGKVWSAAHTAGMEQYFPQTDGTYATDDHLPMNEVAGIPTIDIIPYYEGEHSFSPTWHTVNDTPEHISRETLTAVGQTVLQVLSEEKP